MFSVDKQTNEMVLTRGDSAFFNLTLKNYTIKAQDTIVFSLKRKITDLEPVLQKTAEMGSFILNPSDTLSLAPMTYVYDIQMTTSTGAVYTPIQSTFTLKRGVTE